jgi:signal transduction histidine kinase
LRLLRNGERTAPDFRALFEATRTPCLAFGLPELTALAANSSFLRAIGLTEEDVLGRDLCELFAAPSSGGTSEVATRLRDALDRALTSLAPDVMPIELGSAYLRRSGPSGAEPEPRQWTATTTPVRGGDGKVAFVVQSFEDVTPVTRSQQDLAVATAARDDAQRTSQLKTRFLGMIAHELRTPLTALGLQVERMQRNGADLDYRHRESLERIAFSAGRLREMIEMLLEYARIESGHVAVNNTRFDLSDSVQKTVDYHRDEAEQRGLDLRCSAAEEPALVSTDRRLVELVLSNLIDNAIKFTTAGRVDITLGQSADGAHRVAVSDSGPGIPEAQQKRIFEPFEQLDSPVPKQRLGGIGLGLALVRDIAGALGARIELVSRPHEGSTFTFVLPPKKD